MNGQLPFEGDSFIGLELIKLRDKFNLINCVETGTQYGTTTKILLEIFSYVVTIEADAQSFAIAKNNLEKETHLFMRFGRSEDELSKLTLNENTLYYLDAHGCEIGGSPLKKELEVIASKKHENVCIAIHDFKVPGKDFGYDTYDYELCYEEIEPYLSAIYPNGYEYHYNTEANGANRGIIYIYPKL